MRNNNRPDFDSLEEESKPKKKKFNLFDIVYRRSEKRRKEIIYDPDHKRNLAYFFRMAADNMTNLLYTNLLMIVGNFPIFILMLVFSENLHLKVSAPTDALFAPIYGASMLGASSPAAAAMYGLYGVTTSISLWTTLTKVLLVIGIVLFAFTFGPVNVGTTYILRNMVKGEPLFLLSDFRYAIKRNLKQEFVMGILDLGFTALILYDIYFFYLNIQGTLTGMFFYLGIFIAIVWFVMRFYIYIMMVTFDLSIIKLLKNALIFTLLNIKRNLMAIIGIAIIAFLNYTIFTVFIPLGIVLPFIITLALGAFMAAYAAWPKIKEIMIDPYVDENEEDDEDADDNTDDETAEYDTQADEQ